MKIGTKLRSMQAYYSSSFVALTDYSFRCKPFICSGQVVVFQKPSQSRERTLARWRHNINDFGFGPFSAQIYITLSRSTVDRTTPAAAAVAHAMVHFLLFYSVLIFRLIYASAIVEIFSSLEMNNATFVCDIWKKRKKLFVKFVLFVLMAFVNRCKLLLFFPRYSHFLL